MNKYLFICETNNKIMEELHACRVCLGTDVKLFNMFQYNLVEAYESISNTQVDALDGRPHMLCNCCAVLLRRSAAFQHRCLTSQRLLNTLAVQQKLTTELIKNYINRDEHKLSLPYSISNNELISLDKHDGPQTSNNDNLSKTINDNKTIKLENEYDTSLVEIHIENDNSNTTIKNETDNKYFEPYKVDVDIKVDAIESDNHSNLIDEGISYEYMNDSDSSDEPIAKKAKKKPVKKSAKKQSGSTTKKQQNILAKKQTVKNVAKSKRNTNSKAKNDLKNGEIKKVAKPRTRKVKNESKSDNVSNKDSKIKDKDHSKVADDSKDEDDSKVDKDDDNLKECLKNMDMKILTLEEQKAEVEARKLSDSYKLSPYKCDICYKGFRIETTYKNHMWLHDPACGSFVCPVCGVRARNSGLLSHHRYATHHARFSCRLCAYVTKVKYNATAHCKWHDGHMFICKTCGASFSKQTSFLSHVRARHSGAHACACGAQFVSAYGLHLHKKKAHRESAPKSDCPTCGAQFCSSEALRVHCEGTCDSALKPCVYCGLSFSEATLQEHVKTEHTHKMIHCKECNKSYTEAKYRGHYEGVHLRRRRGAPPAPAPAAAVCEVCGRVCKSRAFLVAHQRRHTGEKPFSCSICPKRFAEKERLQQHIRVHTGERPYKCTLCPKAFQQRSGLNRHRRVHDGSKPYECSHCGKAFSQSNSMKLHIHTVHLKLPTPYRPSRQRKSNVQ